MLVGLARLRLRTLRVRLIVFGLAIQVIVTLALLAGFNYAVRVSLAESVAASAQQTAEMLNLALSSFLAQGRTRASREYFDDMLREPRGDLQYVAIRHDDGRTLMKAGRMPAGAWPTPSTDVHVGLAEGTYHVRQKIQLANNDIGELQFGINTELVQRLRTRILVVTLAVSLLASFLAALLLVLGSHRINRRLHGLVAASDAVAAGNFQVRAQAAGDDELSVLARRFNAMAERIAGQMQVLEESRAKFFAIFNAASVPMSLSRQEGDTFVLDDVNRAWQEQFGLTREQALGRDGVQLRLYRDVAERQALVEQAVAEGFACRELWLRRSDGMDALCQVALTRVYLAAGMHLIFAINDITSLRRYEQELRELNLDLERRVAERTAELADKNARLKEALESLQNAQEVLIQSEKLSSLGSVVAAVAHELNTPIGNSRTVATSLLEFTRQLEARFATGLARSDLMTYLEKARQCSELIDRNLERAGDLIYAFKEVAVDRASSQRRKFDLKTVIDEVLDTFLPTLKHSPYRFEIELPDGVACDSYPGPLGQVLINMVNNAVVHGFGGREHGVVRVQAETLPGDWIRLTISDDGAGIAPQDLPRIFDPFFTTRLGQGGSGLGLNIVHNIVTGLMGGRIGVESRVGEGCRFVVEFPRQAPAEQG